MQRAPPPPNVSMVSNIDILKIDGRISYQKLAELIHLTPRPCQERVKKLERAGIIRGYAALIEEETERATGIVLQLHVVLTSQSGRAAQVAFEAEIKQRSDILSCGLSVGRLITCYDVVVMTWTLIARLVMNGWRTRYLKLRKLSVVPRCKQ